MYAGIGCQAFQTERMPDRCRNGRRKLANAFDGAQLIGTFIILVILSKSGRLVEVLCKTRHVHVRGGEMSRSSGL